MILTNPTSKLMLISAPLRDALPGWMTNFRVIGKHPHRAKHYHGGRLKWLDTRHVNLVNEEIRGEEGATHVEIGFNKRELAHRNVRGGIRQRIYRKSPQVAENGEVV
jgi:hypothetical protein